MTIEEIVKWLNEETSCYAQDETTSGNTCIFVDGPLYASEIKELAKKVEQL